MLAAAAVERGAAAMTPQAAAGFLDALAKQGRALGADQAAAVRGILTSGAKVETLVGPAGTGKSFVVGALAKAWQDPDLWGGDRTAGSWGWRRRRSPPRCWSAKA